MEIVGERNRLESSRAERVLQEQAADQMLDLGDDGALAFDIDLPFESNLKSANDRFTWNSIYKRGERESLRDCSDIWILC